MRVVAIQNFGSSGTTLLHSLLDGHPRILSMPGLITNGYFMQWRGAVGPLELHGLGLGEAVGKIVDATLPLFSGLWDPENPHNIQMAMSQLGDGMDENPFVDRHAFAAQLEALLIPRLSPSLFDSAERHEILRTVCREMLIAAHQAYAGARGRDVQACDVIVFPAHSAEVPEIEQLLESFADVRFVYMMRDVPNNVDSCVKTYKWVFDTLDRMYWSDVLFLATRQFLLDLHPIFEAETRMTGVTLYRPELVSRSRAVRLEQLHGEPEGTMREVAQWLGLEWHPCLLESTFAGLKWWNQSRLKRVSGFSPDIVTTYKRTTAFDRWRMGRLASPVRAAYGYQPPRPWDGVVDAAAMLASLLPFDIERRDDTRVRNLTLAGRLLDRLLPPARRGRVERLARRLHGIHCRRKGSPDGLRNTEGDPLARPIRRIPRYQWLCAQLVGGVAGYLRIRLHMLRGIVWLRRQRPTFVPLLAIEAQRAGPGPGE